MGWGNASRCRTRGPLDPLGRLTKEQHGTQSHRNGHGLQKVMRRRLSSMENVETVKGIADRRENKSRVNAETQWCKYAKNMIGFSGFSWHTRCNIHQYSFCCGGRKTPLMFTCSMR